MKDYRNSVEHLRKEAAEKRLIADLDRATNKAKRETFAKLADHLNALADEVERAMIAREIERTDKSRLTLNPKRNQSQWPPHQRRCERRYQLVG
jgi:hypothetical protein